MTLAEAEKTVLSILKQVMEEKLTSANVEVARVTPEPGTYLAQLTIHKPNVQVTHTVDSIA
jgi:20S proteasome subunit alpha 5